MPLTVVTHLVGEEGPASAALSVEVGGGASNALLLIAEAHGTYGRTASAPIHITDTFVLQKNH